MKFPHPSKESEEFFRSIVPDEPNIIIRPMFGNLASFINGKMFAGLFGDSLFVRLSEKDRPEFLRIKGTGSFEPMQGRPMKRYFVVPKSWIGQPNLIRPWIRKALESTGKIPAKATVQAKAKLRKSSLITLL